MSSVSNFLSQCYPPKSKFDPERDMPDLTGKVIIVTGGNTVYMASRSKSRAERAITDLKQETGKEAIFLELDLASLGKVTKAAKEFMSKEPALHILFNSGGVMTPPIEQTTEDGYDLQFGTNVLGHAHFTLSLLPVLLEGAKSSPDGKARVVCTSSLVAYHNTEPQVKFDTLKDGAARHKLGKRGLYCQSKYGVIAFSNELAKRYKDKGIASNAVNPGNLATELQRHSSTAGAFITNTVFSHPAPMGALTQLYAATSPEVADVNGGWFIPWARQYQHSAKTKNEEMEGKLWDWIEEQRRGHLVE
ncbi:hypothetical protein M407DRAFT_73763 [Tulasnella calospora MUT 4182]|uniref:NAD(P)-binding protein n=1 Tax=Tulasnella calospora MUT 4182 TaxID=1051891 RepID=A0A0C3KZZ7_9AGAM|nr:hypothetical protein M407DRAFT_73763 [Tulasnella calospora MUT 4182]